MKLQGTSAGGVKKNENSVRINSHKQWNLGLTYFPLFVHGFLFKFKGKLFHKTTRFTSEIATLSRASPLLFPKHFPCMPN